MSYECSSARILLRFILITPLLRLVFTSQAVLAVNETIPVPVSLGLTSRDDDALHVQVVFDDVLQEVPDKVNISFGYVKECVLILAMPNAVLFMDLMKTHNVASGLTMKIMGYDVLQTGLTVPETYSSCVCGNMLHGNSGGTSSCVRIERERKKLVASGPLKSVP